MKIKLKYDKTLIFIDGFTNGYQSIEDIPEIIDNEEIILEGDYSVDFNVSFFQGVFQRLSIENGIDPEMIEISSNDNDFTKEEFRYSKARALKVFERKKNENYSR